MKAFDKWIDTLVEEKQLDTEMIFEVEGGAWGMNMIPLAVVIEAIKQTSVEEQAKIKDTLVKIDFMNGDVCHFFKHLAGALAI